MENRGTIFHAQVRRNLSVGEKTKEEAGAI